jgi:heparan-alpha-glucosaminide N-acetyltransferase
MALGTAGLVCRAIAAECSDIAKWITFPDRLPFYVWPFGSGALASIAMAGAVTSTIFLKETRWRTVREKATPRIAIRRSSARCRMDSDAARHFEDPCHTILVSVQRGFELVLFTTLFWICDVKKYTGWAAFLRPAGANTLLTYLLRDFYNSAFADLPFNSHFNSGWPGVARSIVFTGVISATAAVLTKWKIRMQLRESLNGQTNLTFHVCK